MLKKASEKYWNHIKQFLFYLEKMFFVFLDMSAFDVELMTVS